MSVRLIRVLSGARRVPPRSLLPRYTASPSLAQPALSGAAPSRSLFASCGRLGVLSAEESRQTRRVELKQSAGDKPQYVDPRSANGRSPCAAYHDMTDAEYFDPARPLRWLVAMDFSYNAWRALHAAKQLMRRERRDTLVIFAVPPVPLLDVGSDSISYPPPELVEQAVDSAVRQMEAVHDQCRDLLGCYNCEVSEPGDARELVLMRLERKGAAERIDYAVCGQRGKSRLLNIILGSVAVHLVHYAPTSVVVVK